ncbi:heterokaryon incompatibility protein-domain-containing protein [Achaetomium macrosporum]|uniref:Heterokaryon incompatibility protein-domain-containing protein n=1 Tax=Achaetomium macrosporum TaxID=79813 RepID=A0AAN7C821_9PEZI|nr:heterokaryon incompatibility protein-domain-containing protein [Achaetomium macrosporum]
MPEAHEAKKDGCPLFLLYPRIPFYKHSFIQSLYPSDSAKPFFTQGLPELFRTFWDQKSRPLSIAYHINGEAYAMAGMWSKSLSELQWLEESLRSRSGDPAARDDTVRPMTLVPNSESVFGFLREQLNHCLNVHVAAGSCHFQTVPEPPRRLIHIILQEGGLHLRPVEPPQGMAVKWCALSYCWGDGPTLTTTKATLEARLASISFNDLPSTLRDAVLVCQKLDVFYIWIDSLCIVQDDEEEKIHDIAHMPDVYGKAYITLSASSASSVTEGFLHPPTIDMRFTPFALRYRCRDGAERTLVFQPLISADSDPVNLRGWTLQERVLSPRVIDFSNLQVRWRCQTTESCDSGSPPSIRDFDDHVGRKSLQRMEPEDIAVLCRKLVEDYSKRRLTFPKDKLVAFSAIPALLNRSGGYYAGLWAADFPYNLIWGPNRRPSDPRAARPKDYRHDPGRGRLLTPRSSSLTAFASRQKSHVEILDCKVEPAHGDAPFGAISSASITLKGRVARAKWFYGLPWTSLDRHSTQVRLNPGYRVNSSPGLLQGNADAEEGWPMSPGGFVEVPCLLVAQRVALAYGLLLIESGSSGCFQRVGHWESTMDRVAKFGEPRPIQLV